MEDVPSLRVLAYNILGGRNRGLLAKVVHALDPDLMVVNEAPQWPLLWRWQCPSLAREWGLQHVAGGRNAGRNMICAQPHLGVVSTWAERVPQSRWAPIRGVVAAQLRLQGRPFGVVGVHLGLERDDRLEHVSVALRAAGRLQGPVLLAGDLNEDPGGPAWQRFADADFVDPSADPTEPTFPSYAPAKRIDAILVRGDVSVRDCGAAPLAHDLLAQASDHLPVLATVRWG
ncbi:MAG: endonuclease/exonuclease/phosphatase family protein [Actinomycetota bacterium]|nr:endonuclease/exonuclease/phosphatase family protein [Actinomycetota bacterium]